MSIPKYNRVMKNLSPISQNSQPKLKQLDFPVAISAVLNGEKITRVEWADPDTFVALGQVPPSLEAYLYINNSEKQSDPGQHAFKIREVDIRATDWIVC